MKKLITLDTFCYYFVGDIIGNVTIYRVANEIGNDNDNDNKRIKIQQKKPIPKIFTDLRKDNRKFIKNVFNINLFSIFHKKNKKDNNENEIVYNNEENKTEEDIGKGKEYEMEDVEVLDNEDKRNNNIMEGEEKYNKIKGEENKIEDKEDKTEENTGKYFYAKFDRLSEINIFKVELFNKLHAHNEQIRYIDFNKRLNLFLTYALDGFINLYLFPSCKMINAIKISKVTGNAIFTKVLLISNPFPMFICLNEKLIYIFDLKGDCIFVEDIMNSDVKIYIDKNYGIVPDFITKNGEECPFSFIKENEE
jgi:hypothetical protein